MPSIADVIRSRRTIHEFHPDSAPPDALVEAAIEHAVMAPNHYHTRPWRFYLLGPEAIAGICQLNADMLRSVKGDAAADFKLRRWRQVPGWLLLTCIRSDDPVRQREDYAACCCAAQNLNLFLWEQGIGVKWTTGEATRAPGFLHLLGIDPDREEVVGLFWYGRAAAVPEPQPRTAQEVIVRLP